MIVLFIFLIGILIGSFLNVVIYRIPRNESIAFPPSHCPRCKHKLSILDLVPIFSYLSLRGRCRYCHKGISMQYPIVECVTGLLFSFSYLHFFGALPSSFALSNVINLLFYFFILSSLIAIFVIDWEEGIIPFKILFPALFTTVLYLIQSDVSTFWVHLISAFAAGCFFLIIFLVTRGRGMGFGDVVLAFFMGMLLGFPSIVGALYIAFLTGAGVSLILISLGRKKMSGSTIAFGPFLVVGTIIFLFWKEELLHLFLPLIGL